jgi:hypothetical protein
MLEALLSTRIDAWTSIRLHERWNPMAGSVEVSDERSSMVWVHILAELAKGGEPDE